MAALQAMGYSKEHISRAITVHSKSKQGSDYDISLLVEIIGRLKAKDKAKARELTIFSPFYESIRDVLCLKAHDVVDYRFENGRYILCKVVQIESTSKVAELHPLGEPDSVTKHNRHCSIYTEYRHHKLAKPRSISLRVLKNSAHPLFGSALDDYIDVNPMHKHGHYGWRHGRIIKMDSKSSQVKVLYFHEREKTNCSYWFHLENGNEVAAFRTKVDGDLNPHIAANPTTSTLAIHSTNTITTPSQLLPLLETLEVRENTEKSKSNTVRRKHSKHRNSGPSLCSNSLLSMNQSVPSQHSSILVPSSTTSTISDHNSDYQVLDTPIFASSRRSMLHPLSCSKELSSKEQRLKSSTASEISNGLRSLASDVSVEWDDKRIAIVHQLHAFGYSPKDIMRAMEAVNDGHDINQVIEYIAIQTAKCKSRHKNRKSKSSKTRSETPDDETSADDEDEEEEEEADDNKSEDAMYHSFFHHDQRTVIEYDPKYAMNRWMAAQRNRKQTESSPTPALPDTPVDAPADPLELAADSNVLVFGMEPLSLSSQVLDSKDYGAPIPLILIKLKETLFLKNGHLIEGIFRIRSHHADCKLIEERLHDADVHAVDFSKIHCVLIANLIQLWFEKLPRRVLEDVDVEGMKAVKNMKGAEQMVEDEMGEPYESYFKWLLDLCIETTKYEKHNKMSIKNMAEVLAPALFGAMKEHERVRIVKFVQLCILWRHFAGK